MPFPKTFDAFVPCDPQEFIARSKLKPDYVSFETLRAVPLDAEHAASFEYAKKLTPPAAFAHALRTYYFALAIMHNGFPSGTPGVPQIASEDLVRRVYHASVLHDVGWSTDPAARAHPSHTMSFELHGGIMAFEHLREHAPTLEAAQIGDVVQSIMLHTSEWGAGMTSATKKLLSFGALFDICGYDVMGPGSFDFLMNRETVKEIEREYPTGDLHKEAAGTLQEEFKAKPDCLLSHFPGGPEGFLKSMRVGLHVPADQ